MHILLVISCLLISPLLEFAIGNTVRRVLYITREEFTNVSNRDIVHTPALYLMGTADQTEELNEPLENIRLITVVLISKVNSKPRCCPLSTS